jgi:CDP-paratose 2-epimerase
MSVTVITGSAGLIGSTAARHFAALGLEIVGIDNDMRRTFFGDDASTRWQQEVLRKELGHRYTHVDADIRDQGAIERLFCRLGRNVGLVVHTAAQPSHNWAAGDPLTDFGINATGTLHLLEAARKHCREAVFVFTSTNKVYGNRPNELPLLENPTRWEIEPGHPYHCGIPESMPIDRLCTARLGHPRRRPTCWCRSTGTISAWRPCASGADA